MCIYEAQTRGHSLLRVGDDRTAPKATILERCFHNELSEHRLILRKSFEL